MKDISIVERHGTHLLVKCRDRFAVVERRNGLIYGVHPRGREGFPETAEGIAAAVGPEGWADESPSRKLFSELCERGDALARRIW